MLGSLPSVDENFEVNPSLLSALSCYWPLVRLTLNAKTAINRFRVSLRRVYYNDKLQGASDENALRTVHTRANELELMALTPLAHYLANLFTTPNELPYVTSAKEWKRLSSVLQQVHIYFPVSFLDVVLPKLTSPPYMMNCESKPAPLF